MGTLVFRRGGMISVNLFSLFMSSGLLHIIHSLRGEIMGSYKNFSTGRLNFNLLVQDAHDKLATLLNDDLGSKAVVWDERLTRAVGLLVDYPTLKKMGVTRMVSLTSGCQAITDVDTVVFLVKPEVSKMKLIADYINRENRDRIGSQPTFVLCFVPDRCVICEKYLEEKTVLSTFSVVTSLPIRLFPLDSDVLTMQYPSWFKEHTLDGDVTCYFRVAQALVEFQNNFGTTTQVYGKGEAAKKVYDCMKRLSSDGGGRCHGNTPEVSEMGTLLLFDRCADLLSVMATQLTYEGLIDETFGIDLNSVTLPAEERSLTSSESTKQHVLNSADELFTEIRDKNFNAVGPSLSKKAKHVSAQYEDRELGNIGAMKNFVRHVLPAIKSAKESLTLHTSIAERIKERTDDRVFLDSLQVEQELINNIGTDRAHPYVEQLIARRAPLHRVLRLLSLQCWCTGGGSGVSSGANSGGSGRTRLLERYMSDILATYGFSHALTLDRACRAGILRHPPFSFSGVSRSLKLVVHDVSEQQPTDIAYTYSGYAPISVRLAQYLARPGSGDTLNILPGPSVRVDPTTGHSHGASSGGLEQLGGSGRCRLTLMVFLGGVTFAELSALRFLSAQEDAPTEYVVIATDIVNGSSLIDSIAESKLT